MFNLTLVTPQKKIVEGAPLAEVFVPGFRGELEILPGHAPMITTLGEGVIKYKLQGATEIKAVAVSWGYCEVTAKGQVNILVESAEAPEDIDLKKAEASRSESLEKLANVNFDDFEELQRKFFHSEARIKVAKKDFN